MAKTPKQAAMAIARHALMNPGDAEGERRLRAELAESKISQYVERIVADAPPLPAESADRIAALLRDASDTDEAA